MKLKRRVSERERDWNGEEEEEEEKTHMMMMMEEKDGVRERETRVCNSGS